MLKFPRKAGAADRRSSIVKAGNFYWNAGMFFWRPTRCWTRCGEHLPKTATLLSSLPAVRRSRFRGAAGGGVSALREHFHRLRACCEQAKKVVGIACDEFGWNDVGSWNAVYELLPQRCRTRMPRGPELLAADPPAIMWIAAKKLVALLGVKDLIVVDTPDALLIADREARRRRWANIVKLLEKNGPRGSALAAF